MNLAFSLKLAIQFMLGAFLSYLDIADSGCCLFISRRISCYFGTYFQDRIVIADGKMLLFDITNGGLGFIDDGFGTSTTLLFGLTLQPTLERFALANW